MRFVDLFAGLGGFHIALKDLGHECVFASEIDKELRELYSLNFPECQSFTYGDIRTVKHLIPEHEILCAGFPCQPFSKSGDQLGIEDKTRGTLFHEIIDVLRSCRPKYFILENVGNFERHDEGNTWRIVKNSLQQLGYNVRGTEHTNPPSKKDWRDVGKNGQDRNSSHNNKLSSILFNNRENSCIRINHKYKGNGHGLISPHHLGFPQTRERFFIVGCLNELPSYPFPAVDRKKKTSLDSICQTRNELTDIDKKETSLTEQQVRCIDHWNIFLAAIPADIEIPSFPIWGDEIHAKYPYEDTTPWAIPPRELGKLIPGRNFPLWTRKKILLKELPSYARDEMEKFRTWKTNYIRKNREWFSSIKDCIPDNWCDNLKKFPPSLRKLEWNVKGGERNLWRHVLQFRPSGLRVKRYTSVPALVAMTMTQVPILGPERRFISRTEGLRLQGFPSSHLLPVTRSASFAALGNAVHVEVVKEIVKRLVGQA